MVESVEAEAVIADATITCPECGHRAKEVMPTNACQYFYDCKGCGTVLKPLAGDCCVFCSYADVPCPPIQLDQGCDAQDPCHNQEGGAHLPEIKER